MIVTEINNNNLAFFKGAFTEDAAKEADLLVGVIDEEDNHGACGGMALRLDHQGVGILSVYVSEKKRRQGAGSALLRWLDDYVYQNNLPGIRTVYIDNEGTRELHAFFKARGYWEEEDVPGCFYRLSLQELDRKLLDKPLHAHGEKIFPLSELPGRLWNEFTAEIARRRQESTDETKGTYPPIFTRSHYDPQISHFYAESTDKMGGAILISRGAGVLNLEYLWYEGTDPRIVMDMIRKAFRSVPEEEAEDNVAIYAVNEVTDKIVKHLCTKPPEPAQRIIYQYKV